MGFEIVARGQWGGMADSLKEGEVRIGKSGRLLLRAPDLALVGITDRAVLMADPGAMRLALRTPRDGEAETAMLVTTVKGHKGRSTDRRAVNAKRGLDRLGLDPAAAAGSYQLNTKDDLLLVNLIAVGKGETRKM